jgi:phosphoribosylanthranilate isomerase
MFRIKICGITNMGDAKAAAAAGADAIGLNFYRASKRCVSHDAAREIVAGVPGSILKVGVFVNHDADEIQEVAEQLNLDYIQLHGDEPAAFLSELPESLKIVRAFRCGADGLAPLASYLDECRVLGRVPDAVLLDSSVAGAFGGTGQAIDWSLVARERSVLGAIPLILAGGLTPRNVRTAIKAVRPEGVDVASGVERQAGIKDIELMKQFVATAKEAFQLK